jgi:glycosyltransferase involved in cell wall biosynthesis
MLDNSQISSSIDCSILDLSVVIVAQNEERIIGKTLASVKDIAREIVLVDSGSTDRTLEIAKGYGAICHHKEWQGYSKQKNYALSLPTSGWVLSLDADEVLTPALAQEILNVLKSPEDNKCDGFLIPRLLYIGEKSFPHGGFYPDAQLRLIRKGKGQFNQREVHEAITVEGRVTQLRNTMLHYAYKDFDDFAQAMDKYALLSAKEFSRQSVSSWKMSLVNELIHPPWTFFYRFFLRAGFLDGMDGFKANWIYADYVKKKIRYLRDAVKLSDV